MLEKEALNLVLQDIPESIIETMFCFAFLNLRFRWKQILVIAILLSLTNMVELLPLATGVRIIILLIGFVAYLKVFTRKELSKILLAVFVTFFLAAAGDSVWSPFLLRVTGISYSYAYSTPYLRALFSYPTLLTILIVTYFLYRYKKKKLIKFE